jgi:adenylylsulfate kinase
MDSQVRSIAKSFTFRIIATITTITLVFLLTRSLKIAGIVGLLDFSSKIVIYWIHERVWGKIYWGVK